MFDDLPLQSGTVFLKTMTGRRDPAKPGKVWQPAPYPNLIRQFHQGHSLHDCALAATSFARVQGGRAFHRQALTFAKFFHA